MCGIQDYADASSVNLALKLKAPDKEDAPLPLAQDQDGQIELRYFDEKKYLAKTKVKDGQDAYMRHKFNQVASDNFPSNRRVPDVRHAK